MNEINKIGWPSSPGDLRFTPQATGNTRLEEAAREFESLLTESMLRSMRSSIREESETDESYGQGIYEEMMFQQMARAVAQKPGLGVARMISQKLAQQNEPSSSGALPGIESNLSKSTIQGLGEIPAAFSTSTVSAHSALPNEAGSGHQLHTPVAGKISSNYGWRVDPIDGQEKFHRGIDFAAPAGTPIEAVESGRVIFSGKSPQYGNVVVIEHPDKMQTLYAHLAERDVEVGEQVSRNQPIGRVGSTGRSTGPHLHFEVFDHQHNIDPLTRI
jgi:murein DD-endopeptidase MepM/ murein hydrolase activator NlpD